MLLRGKGGSGLEQVVRVGKRAIPSEFPTAARLVPPGHGGLPPGNHGGLPPRITADYPPKSGLSY